MFFARAQNDPVWCRFVARVWSVGRQELRSCRCAISPTASASGTFAGPAATGEEMAEACLQALRADPRRIDAALTHPLPSLHRARQAT